LRYRATLLWASWLAGAMALAPSVYMLEVYGRVVNARSSSTLWMLSLAVVGAFVVMELLEWLRNRMLHQLAATMDAQWSQPLLGLALRARIHQLPGGNTQILNDWRAVLRFVASPPVHGMLEAPVSLLFLLAVFLISPWLGLFALVGAGMQVALAVMAERSTHPILREANRQGTAAALWAEDTVRNAAVLASMGMAQRLRARWTERQAQALQLQAQASSHAGTAAALTRGWQNIISSGLLGLGAWLLMGNALHGGPEMMIVASILGGRVLAPLLQVVTQWSAVVSARLAWQRIHAVLQQYPEQQPTLPLPPPQGLLTVEGLVAGVPGLPGAPAIIKGLSFRLQPGQVLAVVGPSAAGKSTLAKLLVGLWPAQQGVVRLDGYNLYHWNKAEVGQHLGYLPQEVQLLPGTIADNISRYTAASMSALEAAARQVGLHESILALPMGYNTPVSDASLLLSGGQKQRLGLACALFGHPALVVLDEPNSSLDDAGDAALAHAIQALRSRGTTFVIITHRTRILDVADHLLVLADGQAQAFGPKDDVLRSLAAAAKVQP
jgi:ATP-binding cassette, subfamily C, bacterial exporter for protease/lipase